MSEMIAFILGSGGLAIGACLGWFVKAAKIDKLIAEKNKLIADQEKTIEETKNLVTERDKKITEQENIIADTKNKVEQLRLQELQYQSASHDIQDTLKKENEQYNNANHDFADELEQLFKTISDGNDGSESRNNAIKKLTQVCVTFSYYIDKLKIVCKSESVSFVSKTIELEFLKFINMVVDGVEALNESETIISNCEISQEPLRLSDGTFSSITYFLMAVYEKIPLSEQRRLNGIMCEKIGSTEYVDIDLPEIP